MIDLILQTAARTAGVIFGIAGSLVAIGLLSLAAEGVKKAFRRPLRERVRYTSNPKPN